MSATTAPSLAPDQLAELNREFAARSPEALIGWAAATYPGSLALSCSFGGASGMVLLDIALRVDPSIRVLYVDTGYLFPETLATARAAEARYGITATGYLPLLTVDEQAARYGAALWERDPDGCCEIRKVEPMRRALGGFSAYLTGLRRDQASTRAETPLVQWDAKFGLLKLNPLAAWSEKDVWTYITSHGLPYNPLHDQGYPSIGCTNCTRPVQPGDDPRSGRWSGTDKVECGLHTT